MKVLYLLGITICFIISFLSCTKHDESISELLPELVKAEEIMYEAPDSALHILQTMSVPQPSDKLQYATWALLMTQAKYKLYVSQTDSLINIAYSYFMQQNSAQRKAMTLYYKAVLYNEKGYVEEAQDFFLKAVNEVLQTEDNQLAYLIYIGLGNIYAYRAFPDYALENYTIANQYAEKSRNYRQVISSYIHIARVHKSRNNYNESITFYEKAIKLAEKQNDFLKLASAMSELSSVYNRMNDYQSALMTMQKVLELERKHNIPIGEQKYLTIGRIYSNLSLSDSAVYYYRKALTSSNTYTQEGSCLELFYELKGKKLHEEAAQYLEKAWIIHDSILKVDKSNVIIEMQEKYNQQKVINEKNELELKKDKTIHKILVCLICLLITIAMIIFIYQKKLLQKERMIQDTESKMRIKMLQIQENEQIINKNLKHINDLNNQIYRNKDVQEQMEEQTKILSYIKEHNENLKEQNDILRRDIISISSTLKAKSEEIKRYETLNEENLNLRNREFFLTEQLVLKSELLNKLKTKPKYIEERQWIGIIKDVNSIFNDYTIRLSKLIPTLTESDIQICCLIKLHISNSTIATLLAISPTSVTKRKMRLKERIIQTMGSIGTNQSLEIWLWDF